MPLIVYVSDNEEILFIKEISIKHNVWCGQRVGNFITGVVQKKITKKKNRKSTAGIGDIKY